MVAEEARAVISRAFITNRCTLEMVLAFKYLGIVLSAAYDDWTVAIQNLTKVQSFWQIMTRILSR